MRIKDENVNISYDSTKNFFEKRVAKYNEENPYSTTMYQDNNPDLVNKRNVEEIKKLLPLLKLDKRSKVLDIACGVGRWSDAIKCEIEEYCGIDFCDGFIELARARCSDLSNRSYLVGSGVELEKILRNNDKGKFNRILLIGALVYLNDEDVSKTLEQVERACENNAIICIREPMAVESRLTLKDFFSEELNDEYNVIYRNHNELMSFIEETLIRKGFIISKEEFLFEEDALNNRKETAQYYFILERTI